MEDREIVELYWHRDPRAIGESSAKYSRYCFKVAKNILGNVQDCEECVNDTWLHAWNAIPPHRPEVLRLFLARITRRLSFNCFKAGTAQKRGGGQIDAVLDELEECLAGRESVEDELIAKELGQSISCFVRALPEREGNVFLRRYFFTESLEEIAGRYGLTPVHTAVILSRTRKKLKKYLIQEGYFDGSE